MAKIFKDQEIKESIAELTFYSRLLEPIE